MLIGPSKQKRKTPRKECMSVWSSRVGDGERYVTPARAAAKETKFGTVAEYCFGSLTDCWAC